ncbi:UNVERIFIED_CONTAM: hypothetical protein Sradi_0475400 [Sesamum radiatum]|uniref:SWIM-type domain-containing protein n=1 Tax=Sesamum radiatum TaxID=300843 RepID=A0AAW2W8T9_SESRA
MSRIQQKKEGMEKYAGSICPNILKKLNKQQAIARNCFTRWCGESEYEVDQFLDKFVVHLGKRVCSCGMFQLCGYPCAHACAAISSERQNLETFVDDWYKKDTYMKGPVTFDELPTQGSQGPQPSQEPVARGPATVDELPTQGSQGPQTSQEPVTRQDVAETQESPQQNQEQNQQEARKTKESSSRGRGKGKQARSEGSKKRVIYEGPRNLALLGKQGQHISAPQSTKKLLLAAASSSANVAKKRNKMPTIDQVLQNIRDKAKNTPWKP